MRALLFAALIAVICQCTPQPVPTPIEPAPLTPAETASCASMCDRMRSLGCQEGEPTDGGASCEMYCENAQASFTPLPLDCMVRVRSCDQVPRCTK